jgi:hypothetical protein
MARKIRSDLEGVVSTYLDGGAITLAPGDEVPEGVVVGDHLLDDGDTAESDGDGGQNNQPDDGMPRGNASREEWAKYADDNGVSYEPEAKREAIKEAVDKAAAEKAAAEGAGA